LKALKEIWDYRNMVFNLVKRDLRGRYKGSILGFLWTFLNPLLQLVVYTLVFSVIMRAGIDKYYIFLFVALVPWIFFSTSLQGGASSILNQKSLVSKIYFPREVLPIAHVLTCFVNMLLTFIVIFIALLFARIPLNPLAILCLPPVMLVELLLCMGMALLASAITVYLRDFEYILGILVMAWQFLTPVMYSMEMVPEQLHPIFLVNPMTPVIQAYRDILYYARLPELFTLTHAFLLGILVLIAGGWIFSRLKKHFAEEL
jgi:lipopolysaccharide transport system permease protein